MKTIGLLCSVAFIGGSTGVDVTIEHGVEAGTVVTKSLMHTATYELVGGRRRAGDRPPQEMPEDFGMQLEHTYELTVIDTYGAREDGATKSLVRVVDDYEDLLEGEVLETLDVQTVSMQLDSELVDESVAWTRGEDGTWSARLADEESELDETHLAGLVFDIDALGLLPPEGADLEAGWDVPAEAFGDLLRLGGDLMGTAQAHAGDAGDYVLRAGQILPRIGELEGDVKLALKSYDEESGLATIAVAGELDSDSDTLELFRRLTADVDDPELEGMDAFETVGEYEFEGTLEWNVRAGHLAAFALRADFTRTFEIRATIPQLDQEMVFELEFEGEASWKGEFTVE